MRAPHGFSPRAPPRHRAARRRHAPDVGGVAPGAREVQEVRLAQRSRRGVAAKHASQRGKPVALAAGSLRTATPSRRCVSKGQMQRRSAAVRAYQLSSRVGRGPLRRAQDHVLQLLLAVLAPRVAHEVVEAHGLARRRGGAAACGRGARREAARRARQVFEHFGGRPFPAQFRSAHAPAARLAVRLVQTAQARAALRRRPRRRRRWSLRGSCALRHERRQRRVIPRAPKQPAGPRARRLDALRCKVRLLKRPQLAQQVRRRSWCQELVGSGRAHREAHHRRRRRWRCSLVHPRVWPIRIPVVARHGAGRRA